MNTWNIEFIIQAIKCEEKDDYKKKIVKNETVCNFEVTDLDLDIMLKCNDQFNTKFTYDKLFELDRDNLVDDEINECMIKEYYISSYELNFTNKTGKVRLSYPKRNLP